MSDKIISSSLYIPETATITNLWCEVLPQENTLVKGVQYQKINEKEDIVNTVSRKSLFCLSSNPNVTKIELPDHGLMFHVIYTAPGNEISTLYRVDSDTNYVYKISHMILKYNDNSGDSQKTVYILSQRPESYVNIINYLQKYRDRSIDGLLVLIGGEYLPLLEINSEDILPTNTPDE